jgi:hypothetical protein
VVVKAVAIGTTPPEGRSPDRQDSSRHVPAHARTHSASTHPPTYPLTSKTTTAQYNSRGMLYGVAVFLWRCLHALATG